MIYFYLCFVPASKITKPGIHPRRDQEEQIPLLNKAIRNKTKSEKIGYVEIGKILWQEDVKINETLFTDGLYPWPAGYEALGNLLEVSIKK